MPEKLLVGLWLICGAGIGGVRAVGQYRVHPEHRLWRVEGALALVSFLAGLVFIILAIAPTVA